MTAGTLLPRLGERLPVVAVPARNEEMRLPALLDALTAQTWCARGARLPVVLVLNNCTDTTRRVADGGMGRWPNLDLVIQEVTLAPPDAHVGTARRLAMDLALALAGDHPTALLTTDADAVPDPDWVEASLRAISAGAHLVGGRIVGDPDEEAQLGTGFQRRAARHLRFAALADRLAGRIDPLPHDPEPRHHDHTGASLAVRGEVYTALGGLPPLPFREDVAFVSRARASGYLLRHDPAVQVKVSARLVGRAPGGMADCLKAWIRDEEEGADHLVEGVEQLQDRLHRRRRIRHGVLRDIGDPATLPALAWLDDWPCDFTLPEAMAELWAGDDLDTPGETPVETAIAALEALLSEADAYVDAA